LKNWAINIDGAPAWLLPVVVIGGLVLEVAIHRRETATAVPTMELLECIQACDGHVLAVSPTACECEANSRFPGEAHAPVVDPEDCADVCGPGRTQSYSPTAGCVCGGAP